MYTPIDDIHLKLVAFIKKRAYYSVLVELIVVVHVAIAQIQVPSVIRRVLG